MSAVVKSLRFFPLALALFLVSCQPATVTEAAVRPGEVLYRDDFSAPAGGWTTGVSTAGTAAFYQGAFRITVTVADYDLWSPSGHTFGDVRVEVDAGRLAGPVENRFGLVCRYRAPGDFYFFVISSDGYYGLGKASGGAVLLLGQEMMVYSPAIVTGVLPNHLRLDCVGDVLTAYVNGQPVAQARDGDYSGGDVGLLAGTFDQPGVDVIFDNFVVTAP